jgi:hypothetical protein
MIREGAMVEVVHGRFGASSAGLGSKRRPKARLVLPSI